ncbi:hypothetical protein ACWDTI_14445 [Gordonia sp. NPDC003424]
MRSSLALLAYSINEMAAYSINDMAALQAGRLAAYSINEKGRPREPVPPQPISLVE